MTENPLITEILKFDRPKQFPVDEIVNTDDRIARGWMSVEQVDNQGDIIPMSEFRRIMNTWFKRGAPMMDSHRNRNVGKGLSWREATHPKNGKPGIILDYQIFNDYEIDDEVWDAIVSGKRKGLSIGGQATKKGSVERDDRGSLARRVAGLEMSEVSSVENPANDLGENIAVNYLAKGEVVDIMKEEELLFKALQKGFEAVDVKKPFAGFENFDACTAAQKERGHSNDSANRICGFLKARTEKKFMETKQDRVQNLSPSKTGDPVYKEEDESESVEEKAYKSKTDDESESLNSSSNKKKGIGCTEACTMAKKDVKKQDEMTAPVPTEGAEAPPEVSLASIGEKIDQLISLMTNNAASDTVKQDEEEKKPEDETEKKKTEDEEDKKPDETEKKKEGSGEDVVLPKAPAGETDEDAPPVTDKVTVVEKTDLKKAIDEGVKAKVDELLKSGDLKKVTTPRPGEGDVAAESEFNVLDLAKQVKDGKITIADMNRKTRELAKQSRQAGFDKAMERLK